MPLVASSEIILSGSLWWLFIIDTILIASSGYIVNDIFDQDSDFLNKPDSIYVGDEFISTKVAWCYYAILVLVGLFIAAYIAHSIDKLHLLIIYPVAVIMLFLYSKYFKKLPLIGNLVVAIFCAFVPGILLYAEWDTLARLKISSSDVYDRFMMVYAGYIAFAFFSTMVREIVKDIEDVDGDRAVGYKTLPIVWGTRKARFIAFGFGVVLCASYILWILPYLTDGSYVLFAVSSLFMLVTSLYLLYNILVAQTKYHYTKLSRQLKLLMVISLLIFLCNPFFV
jgi:4-hydroxybenzoate polyprenyltransferase